MNKALIQSLVKLTALRETNELRCFLIGEIRDLSVVSEVNLVQQKRSRALSRPQNGEEYEYLYYRVNDDGSIEVITSFDSFGDVKDALDAAGFESVNAEVTRLPENSSELDTSTAEKLLRLVDNLEDLDDTQDVYHNAEIPEEALTSME